ncbi:hypothetical protein [Roseivivax sp. CAU 1761]
MSRVALIDGPLPRDLPGLVARHDFCAVVTEAATSPAATHARELAKAIRAAAPGVEIVGLTVFPGPLATGLGAVIASFERALAARVAVIHCSFGLARPERRLARAVARAQAAGIGIVASAPARGAAVWPAAFAGVLSVQGDARCGPADWSLLETPNARFGACPGVPGAAVVGASRAAAHFTGLLMADGAPPGDRPRRPPAHRGRERRGGMPPPARSLAGGA